MTNFGNDWPDGLSEEVAVIDVSIDELEDRLNISFNKDYDDLDNYKYYVFKFDEGYCALMRYDNAQINGVTLIIEQHESQRHDEVIKDFLDRLHISDRKIIWRRP